MTRHPDKQFANYISQGLKQGFRIRFSHGGSRLSQVHLNMRIAYLQVIRDYFSKELEEDRLAQISLAEAEAIGIHCSPIGIIPKKTCLENGAS